MKQSKGKKLIQNLKKVNYNKSIIIAIFFVLILMFLAFSIRAQTWDLPQIEEHAHRQIEQGYIQLIRDEIRSQNPNLAQSELDRRVMQEYREFLRENSDRVEEEKTAAANQLKSYFRGPRGTHMPDIDTYHYLRFFDNYLEQGFIYDEKTETGFKDTKMRAPLGRERNNQELHPIISAQLYKIQSPFTNFSPYFIFFMTSAIFATLTVIPAFLIGRKFGGNLAGAIAGFIIAVHQAFVGRTIGGYVSTDSYNVLIPLIVLYLIIEAFDSKTTWKQVSYAAVAGLLIGIFSRIWSAWGFLLTLVTLVIVCYIIFLLLRKYLFTKNFKDFTKEKTQGIIIGTLFLSSFIFVGLLSGFNSFLSGITGIFSRASGIQASIRGDGLWPNVFTTVAELNRASPEQIMASMGGLTLFFLAMLGLLLAILPVKNWKKENYVILGIGTFLILVAMNFSTGIAQSTGIDAGYVFTFLLTLPLALGFLQIMFDKHEINVPFALFASIWFLVSVFASTQGVRFLLLLVPAFAIALAVVFARAQHLLEEFFKRRKWNIKLAVIPLILVAMILLYSPLISGYESAKYRSPLMSDAWYNPLTEISETTDEDAIITSWWDYGHWFKAIANRRVTFDGASQNTPMAHWTGKMLSSSSETEVRGILRMLNCGSSLGFETLAQEMHSKNYSDIDSEEFFQTYKALTHSILLNREDARNYYLEIGVSNVEEVLDLTHCDAPQSLVIVSDDMVGKSPVWGHFGGWNFERAYVVNSLRRLPPAQAIPRIEEVFDVNSVQAQRIYNEARALRKQQETNNWISPYPSILSSPTACTESEGVATCSFQTLIQRGQQDVYLTSASIDINNPENTEFTLQFVVGSTPVGSQTINPTSVSVNGRVTSIEGGEIASLQYTNGQAIVLHEALLDSLFVDLFFFGGESFESFERIINYESRITGAIVRVYDVNW
ncbi:MAG: STT3 domain-containing protein [Candidatus Woesearchaeota archaeon]